jgi:hypothetical protein
MHFSICAGNEHIPVPLWEREFCCYVGNISWLRFCDNKHFVGPYNNLDHWDDSGALENFKNAKARFWANYHGQPSDISLPDPDVYIDKVDQRCKVNPELVADLEKARLSFDSDNDSASVTKADKKASQNQSGNWDIYTEKPAEISKWEPELTSPPDATWGVKQEPFDDWGNGNSGWGDAPANPSWHTSSNNQYLSNNRDDFHVGSNNRYQDRSNMPGRKRNSGGHFPPGNNKQRNEVEGYQRSGWQDHRGGRKCEWRPVHIKDHQNGLGW